MYNWIETTFNVSGGVTQAIAVVLALAVVLVLFGLFIFILKRLMGGQTTQNRNRQPRIAVMDSATIDTRRRLVLIRRDNIEHLLLIGGPSDVVVEQNIVRNTPLTQQRPGHGLAGPAPARGPMAPGPDIPARPDDLVAQHEPTPPPAVQARPPATDARPPAAEPAATAGTSAPPPQKAALTSPRPAPEAAPVPAAPQPAPLPNRAPAAASAGTKPEPAGGLNRAADLLRAATQNGFNRATARTPAPETPAPPAPPASPALSRPGTPAATAPVPAATPSSAAVDTAPEVRAAAKPADTGKPQQESKTSSALKSLARPFTARDRPTYGNHSISPPASGPAARAKTALLKPQETPRDQAKVEPVMSTATPASPAKTLAATTALGTGAAQSLTAPEPAPVATQGTAATDKAMVPEDLPAPTAARQEPSPEAGAPEENTPPSGDEAPGTGPHETTQDAAGSGPDISLDISDLLEEAPQTAEPDTSAAKAEDQPGDTPEDAPEGGPDEAPVTSREGDAASVPEPGPTEQNASPAAPPAEEDKDATGADQKAAAAQSTPKPATGLGDKNPIEEEMAKILDELGGQAN